MTPPLRSLQRLLTSLVAQASPFHYLPGPESSVVPAPPPYHSKLLSFSLTPCSFRCSHSDLPAVPQACQTHFYLKTRTLAVPSDWTISPQISAWLTPFSFKQVGLVSHESLYSTLQILFAMFRLPSFSGFAPKRTKIAGSPSPVASQSTQDHGSSLPNTTSQTSLSKSLFPHLLKQFTSVETPPIYLTYHIQRNWPHGIYPPKKVLARTSNRILCLVGGLSWRSIQRLRLCAPTGTQVRSLVKELDPPCHN